jgi:hypothetical protein
MATEEKVSKLNDVIFPRFITSPSQRRNMSFEKLWFVPCDLILDPFPDLWYDRMLDGSALEMWKHLSSMRFFCLSTCLFVCLSSGESVTGRPLAIAEPDLSIGRDIKMSIFETLCLSVFAWKGNLAAVCYRWTSFLDRPDQLSTIKFEDNRCISIRRINGKSRLDFPIREFYDNSSGVTFSRWDILTIQKRRYSDRIRLEMFKDVNRGRWSSDRNFRRYSVDRYDADKHDHLSTCQQSKQNLTKTDREKAIQTDNLNHSILRA